MPLLEGIRIANCLGEDAAMVDKRRLGRGLDALLASTSNHDGDSGGITEQSQVAVEQIDHNPFQPRKMFDDEELSALSDSIRTHGILQPLVVRQVGDRY